MNWIFLAITTAFFYGAYNVLIKVSSGNINQILGAVILQIVAAVMGGILFFLLRIGNNAPLQMSQKGFIYAVLAGIFVGLAEIATFVVFSKGIPVSIGTPIIIGGSVLITSILGIFFLKESFSLLQGLAVVLIIGGIVLLTTTKG